MAELNLNQITEKLNAEFAGEARRLIFWYDADAEFAEDVDSLELTNAKVLHLETDNQFYIKYFLECEDTENNYLVYAPFPKPNVRDNHLADMVHYSRECFADRASLLALDLGIGEKYKDVLRHYIRFFAAKDRTQKFYELEIEVFNKTTIETALMSVLCKCKTASFEEVLRCVLTDYGFEDNKHLAELEKFDLLPAFWEQAESIFGYSDPSPSLEKLTLTMFATYAARCIRSPLPEAWKPFANGRVGNIIAFLDNLMNSLLYGERFDELSARVYSALDGSGAFEKMGAEALTDCFLFAQTDDIIIRWMTERLVNEDTGARLNGMSIPEVCDMRMKNHFGALARERYLVVKNAWHLLSAEPYSSVTGTDRVIRGYLGGGYETDRHYRYFCYWLDRVDDSAEFDELRSLVENVYIEYLNKVIRNYTNELVADGGRSSLPHQTEFYSEFVRYNKERTVVIISDAMRYEVGHTLFERLTADEKCTARIDAMQSVLPSYTRLGMAALLPHRSLSMTDDHRVLADDKPCDDLKQREAILQAENKNSRCVRFDDIKNMNRQELRSIFTGMEVVYVYHNQIDARGDKPDTENEVFDAAEEAVSELHKLIKDLTVTANTIHFIVTADHGFIYRRNRLCESDKINIGAGAFAGRRYVIADKAVDSEGVEALSLGASLGNDDPRIVSFPAAADIFKLPGGGMNYVHGGASPQEMIIPVIDVRTEKGHREVNDVSISLVSLTTKITNLITALDFIQNDPVSDVLKKAVYRIYFVDETGEKISNEHIYNADSKSSDAASRVFRLRFSLKNRSYSPQESYYLVAVNEKNNMEALRHKVVIDIAFANDFGF